MCLPCLFEMSPRDRDTAIFLRLTAQSSARHFRVTGMPEAFSLTAYFPIAFFISHHYTLPMSKEKIPSTPAILALKEKGADFTLHTYGYEERGGTKVSSQKLGADEHCVIKTLVMEDETATPLIILMHGDKEVSTKALARLLNVKSIIPCKPNVAQRHTGYLVGGTSPFGTRKPLTIYMERSIAALPYVLINAGSRGLLAKMTPAELIRLLEPCEVSVAI